MIDRLVDSVSIAEDKLNLLFAALFLTSIAVFIGGDLLLQNSSVLLGAMKIALSCLALLPILYALSRLTKSVTWGLVLTYGLMLILVYSRQAWLIPVMYVGMASRVGLYGVLSACQTSAVAPPDPDGHCRRNDDSERLWRLHLF